MLCKRIYNVVKYRNCTFFKYFSHSSDNDRVVRVRFAPSPTGYLHLGGLRTALYNYLFAKSCNGTMILRIEDTDQTRLVPDAVAKLEQDLNWAGINCNESPSAGGNHGPYIQSERLELYKENVQVLLDRGAAYRCFCTDRRLDLLRREALRARQIPKYDNRCRHLNEEDLAIKMRNNNSHCVRFKLLPEATEFHDIVYGKISSDACIQEGDPVILKSDGFPTYHLANVVDDHLMEISHVLRGVEWQISTQKHLQLYRAFGWKAPRFAHLPLIMNADGSKLSKRQGDVSVEHFKAEGIFPLALVNYVTNVGGGFVRSTAKPASYTLDQLAGQFDLSLVNTNSCRLSPDSLLLGNGLELRRRLLADARPGDLVREVQRLVTSALGDRGELALDDHHVAAVLAWAASRVHRLQDLALPDLAFLWVMPAGDVAAGKLDRETLENIRSALGNAASFQQEDLKQFLRDFATSQGVPFPQLMRGMRATLSGLKEGPGVAEMMSILGRQATLDRMDRLLRPREPAAKETDVKVDVPSSANVGTPNARA